MQLRALNAHLNIALLHHPLDWLHDAERANIKAMLQANVDLLLRGHLHEKDVASVIDPSGGCVHLSAGACYQTRKWPNRALLCRVNLKACYLTTLPIRYEDSPNEVWTVDPSLFPFDPDLHYAGHYPLPRREVRSQARTSIIPATTGRAEPTRHTPPTTLAPTAAEPGPVHVFISYAHKDESFLEELQAHLALLQRQGAIESWHDRTIMPGAEWQGRIDEALKQAQIVLLLISADFLASNYIWDVEVSRALSRHDAGKTRVVPIILRSCDWQSAPFARLQALPRNACPVTLWQVRNESRWVGVARGLGLVSEQIERSSPRSLQ